MKLISIWKPSWKLMTNFCAENWFSILGTCKTKAVFISVKILNLPLTQHFTVRVFALIEQINFTRTYNGIIASSAFKLIKPESLFDVYCCAWWIKLKRRNEMRVHFDVGYKKWMLNWIDSLVCLSVTSKRIV